MGIFRWDRLSAATLSAAIFPPGSHLNTASVHHLYERLICHFLPFIAFSSTASHNSINIFTKRFNKAGENTKKDRLDFVLSKFRVFVMKIFLIKCKEIIFKILNVFRYHIQFILTKRREAENA